MNLQRKGKAAFWALGLCAGLWCGCGGPDASSEPSAKDVDARYVWETKPVEWQISGRPRGETVRASVPQGIATERRGRRFIACE